MKKLILILFLLFSSISFSRLEDVYGVKRQIKKNYSCIKDNYENLVICVAIEKNKNMKNIIDNNIVYFVKKNNFKIINHNNFNDYEMVKLKRENKELCYIITQNNMLYIFIFHIDNKETKNFLNYINANTNKFNDVTIDVKLEML